MTATRLAYQYVVLRCVPRVDREEFVNVGVVVYYNVSSSFSYLSALRTQHSRGLGTTVRAVH